MDRRLVALLSALLLTAACCGCPGTPGPQPSGAGSPTAHPAGDPATKLLHEFVARDVGKVGVEMIAGALMSRPNEESAKLVAGAQAAAEKFAALSPEEPLDQAGVLTDLLARPEVGEVVLKLSESGSAKYDRLRKVLGEPQKGKEGSITLPVADPASGAVRDADVPVVWHHWSWASVATHDGKMVAVELDAQKWRQAPR